MKNKYAFHCTVRGYSHIKNGTVCEDYSDSYSDEAGQYYVAAIADGHGDPKCFRSERGSKFAVEAAVSTLKSFAEEILENEKFQNQFLEDNMYQKNRIRALTNEVYYKWEEAVLTDFKTDSPAQELLMEQGYPETGLKDEESLHIYGATIIAALLLPQCLVLIHQGDGRCEVIYNDGTVDQPVPWDDRCYEERTTSLCNEDVLPSFRHCVIDFKQKMPIACYVCSDGVEDSYRDTYENMGGVHAFFKDLTCQITGNLNGFQVGIADILEEVSKFGRFSKQGSFDDVSVAGIVDLEECVKLKKQFELEVKKYALGEDLFWKEDELRGKMRKHGILQRRLNEATEILNDASNCMADFEKRYNVLSEKRDLLSQEAERTKAELEKYKKDSGEVTDSLDSEMNESEDSRSIRTFMRMMALTAQQVYDQLANGVNQIEARYRKQLEQMLAMNEELNQMQKEKEELEHQMHTAEEKFREAQEKFTEYDEGYQKVDAERRNILEEISNLEGSSDGE